MNKRLRRPLSALTTTLCCVLFFGTMTPVAATEGPTWRLSATPVEGASNELRDVRLVSSTTYVAAQRAVVRSETIEAFDATIYVGEWSLRAARLKIDLNVDAVEITTLRTDAPQE